jgi:hypothetical protein
MNPNAANPAFLPHDRWFDLLEAADRCLTANLAVVRAAGPLAAGGAGGSGGDDWPPGCAGRPGRLRGCRGAGASQRRAGAGGHA